LAAEKLDTADPINLGSGHEIAIRDLAQTSPITSATAAR